MSKFDPAAIKEILESLDHKNNALWTDDGSPIVSEIQRLANDTTITRAQINSAFPGFSRKATGENDGAYIDEETQSPVSRPEAPTSEVKADAFDGEPELNGAGDELSTEEVRNVLTRRVRDAEQALADARRGVSDAQQHMLAMEKRLTRAMNDHQRKFPPISAAQNIKDHLASQQRLAMERAGVSQVDISMQRSNRRGWTRPTRPVNNAA